MTAHEGHMGKSLTLEYISEREFNLSLTALVVGLEGRDFWLDMASHCKLNLWAPVNRPDPGPRTWAKPGARKRAKPGPRKRAPGTGPRKRAKSGARKRAPGTGPVNGPNPGPVNVLLATCGTINIEQIM